MFTLQRFERKPNTEERRYSFTSFSTQEQSGEQKFPCNLSANKNVKMVCNSLLFKALHSDVSERTLTGPFTKRIIIWNCDFEVMEKALPYVLSGTA